MSGIFAEGKLFKAKTKLFLKKFPQKTSAFNHDYFSGRDT